MMFDVVKIVVFCDRMPCSLACGYQCFELVWRMEAVDSDDVLVVTINLNLQCHTSKDSSI